MTIKQCIFAIYIDRNFKILSFFVEDIEKKLLFLRSLKTDSFIFGDLNIDTLKTHINRTKYEIFSKVYDFKAQCFLPTRVTTKSKTCKDHAITAFPIETRTIF